MNELRIVNIVMTGKLPFKKFNIISVAEKDSDFDIVNGETCPILMIRLDYATVSVWTGGSINIVGLKSERDGYRAYEYVKNKIRRAIGMIKEPPP